MYIFISIFTQINKIILIKLLGRRILLVIFPPNFFSVMLPYPWICVVLVAFTYNSAIPSGYESCPMYTPLDVTIIPQKWQFIIIAKIRIVLKVHKSLKANIRLK